MTLTDLPLFAPQAAIPPMVRRTDRQTSHDAAKQVQRQLGGRHELVLLAFREAGADGLTDRELETQPKFALWAPSTARKRRSELFQMGYLVDAGRRDGMTVWRLA